MPPPAVFKADPLLSRKAAAPGPGGFDVLNLLAPARPAFQPDPVLSGGGPFGGSGGPGGVARLGFNRSLSGVGAEDGAEGLQGQEVIDDREGADGAQQLLRVDPTGAPAAFMDGAPGGLDQGHGGAHDEVAAPAPTTLEDLLQARYREGFEDGLSEGNRLAADEAASVASHAASSAASDAAMASASARDAVLLLESLSRALQPLLLPDDAATRFEPLKRLALHLAMELVRTELSVSPQVVEGLVRRSVQALQAGEHSPLVVELNPQDMVLMKALLADPAMTTTGEAPMWERVQWKEDAELTRGSVRARSDVSTVEDLIQHRLASIMQDLRIHAGPWQRDEAALQARLSAAPSETGPLTSQAPAPERLSGLAGQTTTGDGDA